MGKELKEYGEFRDNNDQSWDIGVYQHDDGVQKFSTVVRSPEGQHYTPEEDFLGDYHLIDAKGVRHNDDLPMSMAALQTAVEAVEDVAWGRKGPNQIRTDKETQQWEDIVKNFDKETEHPLQDETRAVEDASQKASWRDRIKEGLEKVRSGGQEVGR